MTNYYADDVAVLLSHSDPAVLVEAAIKEDKIDKEALGSLYLATAESKSKSIVFSPFNFSGGIFRRRVEERAKEVFDSHENLARIRAMREQVPINGGGEWSGVELERIFARLPYGVSGSLKLLGMHFDVGLDFRTQLSELLGKAGVRFGLLARVSGSSWGLETNTLRLTCDALIVSLIRYGLVVTGAGLFERHFSKIETRLTNVAARRILGIGRSARLIVLHAVAGVQSAHNLFLLNCAFSIDRGLRAGRSSFRESLLDKLEKLYRISGWHVNTVELEGFTSVVRRISMEDIRDFEIQEKWYYFDLRECSTTKVREEQ